MEFVLLSLLLGFLIVLVFTPVGEKYLASSGIYGRDQQKPGKPRIPTSGGLVVTIGFLTAITFYAGATSLFTDTVLDKELLFAALSSATLITLIGLMDDIHIDYKKLLDKDPEIEVGDTFLHRKADLIFGPSTGKEERVGLSQTTKLFMILPASFPLIAAGAGSWFMILPIVGEVHWGLFYPLVLLPLGLLFVTNVVNSLAGTNGLAAGLSLVTSLGLGIFGYINGQLEAAILAFCLSASLAGFLYYNNYPASVLPGDSLTYLCGAVIFSSMVIGDMEKFGVFIFTLWFIELLLKSRSRFKAESWGTLQDDGTLDPGYSKNYSLTHVLMRRGLTEKQITYTLVFTQTVIVGIGLVIFSLGWL